MAISQSVLDCWQANDQVNANLLEHLSQEMMSAQTPGGGMTVAGHLAELAGTPEYWVSRLAQGKVRRTQRLYSITADDEFVPETDLEKYRAHFREGRDAALAAAQGVPDGETGEAPHLNADAVLLHMIVHDSHHRGQLLLALKVNGFPLPSEEAMWLPWRDEWVG